MTNPEDIKKLVGEITDFVNSFTVAEDAFCETMSREHRTLQQSFTRLCLKWLEHCASDEYEHDPRNQDSHEISQRMVDLFKDVNQGMPPSNYLPFI